MFKTLAVATALTFTASAASALVTVTIEAPTVVNTTVALTNSTVINFNAVPVGANASITSAPLAAGATVSYDSFTASAADIYGGAANTTYSTVGTATTITLGNTNGAHYFGLWASALDTGNVISIYKGSTLLYTQDLYTAGNVTATSSAYNGNPTAGTNFGSDAFEKFVFFNFTVDGTGYDKIVLSNAPGGGAFENDNNTFGNIDSTTVPEPASWALMVTGFAMVGFSMRKRSRYATA